MPSMVDYSRSTEYVDRLSRIVKTGGKENNRSHTIPHSPMGPWIRAKRVRHLVAQWLLTFVQEHERSSFGTELDAASSTKTLSFRTGVPERRIRGILNGEQYWVSFNITDKILTGLDMTHLWLYPPTNKFKSDGFSDIYDKLRET